MKAIVQGVYFLFDGNECVYVGSSSDIWRRIPEHLRGVGHTVKKKFDSFEIFEVEDEFQMIRLEYRLIQLLKPKYNNTKDLWGKNVPKKNTTKSKNKMFAESVSDFVSATAIFEDSIGQSDVDYLFGFPQGTTSTLIHDGTIPNEFVVCDPRSIGITKRVKTEYVDKMFVSLKLKGE